jgi:hypothetical protein
VRAADGHHGAPTAEDYESLTRTMGLQDDSDNEDTADDNPGDDGEVPSGNSEAARYRHRLRDAKAELAATQVALDALQERVDTMHRAEAESIAAGSLIEAADLWRDGAALGDIHHPDGDVDENACASWQPPSSRHTHTPHALHGHRLAGSYPARRHRRERTCRPHGRRRSHRVERGSLDVVARDRPGWFRFP